ncbi:MAG TPA: hypothetical protein VNB90_07055 [Cytophagaceae bacterium]|jgi:hypothetical protein|nr:hypothetical protein [Cytophagaceae bacterium]
MKKNIVSMLLACCFVIGVSVSSIAQDTVVLLKVIRPYKTKMFTVGAGYMYADVTGLNLFLAPGTPGGFNNNFGMLGLQYTTECKRFIYGWTLQGGMTQRNTVINYNAVPGNNIEYYASNADLLIHGGYSIVSTDRIKFYPMLGVGVGAMKGTFNRTDNMTRAQFAGDPTVSGTIAKYMGCLDASLSFDVLFPCKKWSEDGRYGHVLGLRVGYTQGFGGDYWRFDGARILENPGYNPGMAYAKVQFGLFRKKYKDEEKMYIK